MKKVSEKLLEIKNLKTYFRLLEHTVKAVDDISLNIGHSEVIGLVGESGSGKTVTAYSILKLVPYPGQIEAGEVLLDGQNLLTLRAEELRQVRGKEIAMIFQDPFGSFNPVYTIGDQITEVIQLHQGLSREKARQKAIEMLTVVKLSEPHRTMGLYPHELSGGMCQRAMIAMALACQPRLLIADEPTTSLDVTIQAQILELLKEIKNKFQMSILLITHDLGVIAQLCDRVYVMKDGKIVEQGSVYEIFENPRQDYTKKLLASVPIPDPRKRK